MVTAGHEGSATLTYRVVYVDHKLVAQDARAPPGDQRTDDRGREGRHEGAASAATGAAGVLRRVYCGSSAAA